MPKDAWNHRRPVEGGYESQHRRERSLDKRTDNWLRQHGVDPKTFGKPVKTPRKKNQRQKVRQEPEPKWVVCLSELAEDSETASGIVGQMKVLGMLDSAIEPTPKAYSTGLCRLFTVPWASLPVLYWNRKCWRGLRQQLLRREAREPVTGKCRQ